jgi:hypothetical protein
MRYLYRGFGVSHFRNVKESLTPKALGKFEHIFHHDDLIAYDGSATYGDSAHNAVLRHQIGQAGLPTAGISTSPHRERAIFYALWDGRYQEGIVITIDRNSLAKNGVLEYIVSATVTNPSIPIDDEVILVSASGGPLPLAIVVAEEKVYV